MTQKLTFATQTRDIVNLLIEGRIVTYYDKIWVTGVQFLPKDPQFMLKLIMSRNRIPFASHIIQWITDANSGKNLEQYNACKTEEDITALIRVEAQSKGLIEVKNNQERN